MPQSHSPTQPQRFEQLVGNRHVIEPISRAIARGRLSNLLLFTGPTGSGKTTVARIIARRLLCLQPRAEAVEGCTTCEVCRCECLNNYHYYEELDAADPRTEGRFDQWSLHDGKFVYFIDEIQELPGRAMVRLRKLVDDNAATVIMATTHFDKIDDALANRLKSFTYELRRPGADEIADYLQQQARRSGVTYARRDQLMRVAEGYHHEMRPCAKFMAKVLAETENGVVTDAYLDALFPKRESSGRCSQACRPI